MTRIYAYSLSLTILTIALVQGQNLEDKVAQAKAMQAQSMLGADQSSIDSILADKAAGKKNNSKARREGISSLDSGFADSLVNEPRNPQKNGNLLPDSIRDSSGTKRRNAVIPKRYEQRIFNRMDRNAFTSSSSSVGRDYVLGAGDEIQVSLWGDKEKVYYLNLNKEGKVFLEGVGLVRLEGLNLDQAEKNLRERLAKVYSGVTRGTTHLDVSIGRPGPIKVFIMGEMKLPGGYVFSGNSGVLAAMYYAEGPTNIGTVRNLQLTRAGTKYSLDLYNYLIKGEALTPNFLQDGDILFAGRADILVDIDGEVGRPATYELRKGEGIKELLQFAGGVNPLAASHKISLQRVLPGGSISYVDLASPQEILTGKTNYPLEDGDKVLVEKSTETLKNFLTITGPVKYPGTYSSDGVTTAKSLIERAGGLREDAFLGRIQVVRFMPDGSSTLLAYPLDSNQVQSIPLQPKDNVILYSVKDMYLPDSVEIAGAVFNPGRFEFRAGMSAKDLVMEAGGFLPHHEKGKIVIFHGTPFEQKVEQITLSVPDGLADLKENFILQPNDFVQIPTDPRWYKKEIVTLEGLFQHPGKYALLYPEEKISSVIERADGFKPNAYVEGGRFFRSKDSVGRVGVDIRKAINNPKSKINIGMVGGDSIYIPDRLNTVKVIGEVGFETSVLFKQGNSVQYYIERAGGFTRRSEKDKVVVQYANGETSRDGYFNRTPDAGSVIYVPQGPEPKSIDWASSINAILGTLGVATAVILSIQAINR